MNNFKSGVVALIGPPNAGKSTLLNALIGEKVAIVSPKPQTTRSQITGILNDDNRQIVFLDTPGIHKHKGKMNKMLVDAAWKSLLSAQAIVLVLDAGRYVGNPQKLQNDLRLLSVQLAQIDLPLSLVLNKIDLFRDKSSLLPLIADVSQALPAAEIFPVSARLRDGLEALLAHIVDSLPVAPPMFPPDQLSTLSVRFMAAEIIREKLFLVLEKELPYQVMVEIESWNEKTYPVQIGAVISVGSPSHKGIVIGKAGSQLKEVGRAARKDIAAMLGSKVFLELWVRVKQNWTEDKNILSTVLGEEPLPHLL